MIRRHLMALRAGLMLLDGALAVGTFVAVAAIRFRDGGLRTLLEALGGTSLWLAAAVFAIIWVAALWMAGLYRLDVRWRAWSEVRDISHATIGVLALTLSTLFLVKGVDVSRLFLGFLFVAQPAVTLFGRLVLRSIFEAHRRRGNDPRFMLVVGTGDLAQDFADRVERHAGLGIRVIGHLQVEGESASSVSRPVMGRLNEFADILHSQVVDEVAVCLPSAGYGHLEKIAGLAADEGKTVRLAVDPVDQILPGAIQEEFDGFLIRSISHDSQRDAALILKRLIDIAGALVALVLLSPLLIAVAAWIRFVDGPPVLFKQTRIGLHGRPFTMYKFRSMVRDAEQRLHEVEHLNERSGAAFKAANDPRITPIGRWLRKTSLDELPQLLNVLTGTMSLVGPRPPLPREVAEYDIWHRRRLSMKPGITGLWQIEARHEPDFDKWVEHDLLYIDGWSLWLDFKIMLRTLPALLTHRGQ